MSKKLTTEEFINELKKIDINNLINYNTLIFKGNEIEYKCNKCGKTHLYQKRGQLLKGYICYTCDGKLESFLNEANEKYNNLFSYITDYDNEENIGFLTTRIDSENCKIGVICNKHKKLFETKIKSFLKGEELCPICKFENSAFISKIKKKSYINLRKCTNGNNRFNSLNKRFSNISTKINIHISCEDIDLINNIICFLISNTSIFTNCWGYDIFIDENYEINAFIIELCDLNKLWRGINVYLTDGGFPKNIKFNEVVAPSFNVFSGFFNYDSEKYDVNYINNLIGCPNVLYGDFICNGANLKSIEGCTNIIYGNISLKNNIIENLNGCPSIIYGNFDISNNRISSIRCFDEVECEVFGKLNRKNNLFIE